jgi:N-acetylglucosamine kinase-like BadF-type ATPase
MTETALDACVLGVDGGGSKTHVVVADVTGAPLGEAAVGASNWERVGLDGTAAVLTEGVRAALAAAGRDVDAVQAAVFALAGCDWPSDHDRLTPAIGALGLAGPTLLVNDARAALRAGTHDGVGVVSIAGSGGSTMGLAPDGRQARTFAVGWGEGNGASDIAREALHAVARAHHRSAPPTELTATVLQHADVDSVEELFERLSRGPRPAIDGRIAPAVFAAAAAGDETAIDVVTTVGSRHGSDVVGVARRLGLDTTALAVVRAGGLHRAADVRFDAAFDAAVLAGVPDARIGAQVVDRPVVGAVMLALDLLVIGT